MVFQSYALFPNMTVADNIGFGLKVRKRPKADITKRVGELLELIHLEGRGDRYPWQLSGGQQQRVALARALAIEPQVLLLDEPLSALDAKIRIVLRKEIRAIQRQLGITTVYVTHDQEEALSLSDRVVVMSDGRIEQIGTPSRDLQLPEHGVRGLVRRARSTWSTPASSTPRPGRLSIDGQEIRTPARPRPRPRPDGRVTLALRPEGIALGEGEPGVEPPARHGRGHQLPGLDRAHPGRASARASDGEAPTVIALDTFNEPHLQAARRRRGRDDLVPARGVLRARRGARRTATASAEAGAEV